MFMAHSVDRRRDHRMPALAHHREQDLFRLGHVAFQLIRQGQQRFGLAKRGRFTVAMPGFHLLRQRDQAVGFAAVGVMVAGQDMVGRRGPPPPQKLRPCLRKTRRRWAGPRRCRRQGFPGKVDHGAVPSVGPRAGAPRRAMRSRSAARAVIRAALLHLQAGRAGQQGVVKAAGDGDLAAQGTGATVLPATGKDRAAMAAPGSITGCSRQASGGSSSRAVGPISSASLRSAMGDSTNSTPAPAAASASASAKPECTAAVDRDQRAYAPGRIIMPPCRRY